INDKIEYHCLIKDSVYYIQVDGTSAGKQGFFDLKIEDKIPTYNTTTGKPSNDDFAAAESITVNSEQCPVPIGTFSGQDIQGSGNWSTLNYKYPSIDKKNIVAGACNTNQNCGDIWYYFDMPTIDCTPGYSAVTIQGHSDQIGGISGNYNDLKIIAYSGNSLATLTPILCGESDGNPATNDYFNFEVAGSAGERIYLQVFDKNTNDTENDGDANESFQICVSQRKGMDLCTSLATQPNMQYGVDYCWNIKGASSEPISSSYGENSSTTDPTDNSVYYKFKMPSNICNDLKITFSQLPSSFLESGSTNANQRLSLTIYREDGTPCDGAPNSALINEFWQANSSSGVLYSTTINMSSFGLDTNKIYYIQIDGNTNDNGIVNDGIIRIDTIPKCFNFVANTRKDTSVGYDICSDGWRHYYTLNGGKQHIFSLYPNENNIEGKQK
ncbi:MAG: hypothetical protein IPP53_17080, partial [Bacteroidetes bacterium]|nr:hypothetical protein [Bacteroidota bacterium]